MRQYAAFVLALSALCFWLFGYSQLVGLVDAPETAQRNATNMWMLCDAVAKVCILLSFSTIAHGLVHLLGVLILGFAANNLYDEVRGNPLELNWPELVIAVLLSIYISYKMVKMYGKNGTI